MEGMSFDNFGRLLLDGVTACYHAESDDCDALPVELLEAFLSNVDTDTPAAPAPPHCFALPKSDNDVKQGKLAAIPVKTQSGALRFGESRAFRGVAVQKKSQSLLT